MDARVGHVADNSDEWISRATLKNEVRPLLQKSVMKHFPAGRQDLKVPSIEDLRVGDVVLSRQLNRLDRTPKFSLVEQYQKKLEGVSEEHAYWTHASLYVGEYHIVESQSYKENTDASSRRLSGSGVRVNSIAHYSSTHDLKVLRCNIGGFDEFRYEIARLALLEAVVAPRRYDWLKAASAYLERWPNVATASRRAVNAMPNGVQDWIVNRTILCSELVLECYVFGALIMPEQFDEVRNGKMYSPCHFLKEEIFDEVEVRFKPVKDENSRNSPL